mgnify:CR=1 FL=1
MRKTKTYWKGYSEKQQTPEFSISSQKEFQDDVPVDEFLCSDGKDDLKTERRDFLFTATYAVGAVGVGATIWPMIDQMNPDASVKALASTEVDVSTVTPGKTITVLWRGKPVFIRRRTQEEISQAKSVKMEELKHPEKDEDRAKNPEWLVMLGVCTHLGCVPLNDKGAVSYTHLRAHET